MKAAGYIARQIERINDESRNDRIPVILQLEPPPYLRRFLDASARALRERNAVPRAKDLAPPDSTILMDSKGRRLRRSGLPIASTFKASLTAPSDNRSKLETGGTGAIKALTKSPWYTDLLRALPSKMRTAPVYFWSSSSAVLTTTKKQLQRLGESEHQGIGGLAGVFVNRKIAQPPVFRAKDNVRAVAVSKGYTWGMSRTGAMSAWGAFGVRGEGTKVAVLDTGIDPHHPDLKGKIVGFAEFNRQGERTLQGIRHAYDDSSHGTHCAGTVVGGNASGNWIGMAPKAKVLAGLVLKRGYATDAQIIGGMEWAIERGADVISLSLGGLSMSPDVLDTYTQTIITANLLGIPVVVAVGNDGSQTTGSPGNDYYAFTVGATDYEEKAAGFSGGRTQIITESRYIDDVNLPLTYSKPDVVAPGVDVYSAIPGGRWQTWSGTSMATPHVAGAMALLLSALRPIKHRLRGSDRTNLLQSLLISTVKEMGEAGQNHRFGHGRINVLRALGYAKDLGYIHFQSRT